MTTPIQFELTANDSSAQAAWKRQEAALNAVIEKMSKMEGASKKAGDTQGGWLSKGVTQVAGMAAGYMSVTSVIGEVIAANQQMIQQADAAASKYDTLFRKVNVQANTQGVAGEAGKKRILDNAYDTASTVEESSAIAQALSGSGFSAEQATGDALKAVLQAQAAMGQQGTGQGAAIAEATAKYMNAMNIEMTGENMRRELIAMQQSAKEGFAKFEDMGALSGKVGGFSGKASSADVMAAFNIALKNSASADTASTGLKIFGDRLMGAKGDSNREELLKQAGLQATDVDFIGEDMDTVMERLATALDGMKEEDRAPWLQKMFGTEASGIAAKLIENRGEMQTFRDVMGNEEGFNTDVQEMTTGNAAATRRLEVDRERMAAEKDRQAAAKLRAAQNIDMANGEASASTWVSTTAANVFMGVGFSPEDAVGMAFGTQQANEALATTEAASQGVAIKDRKQIVEQAIAEYTSNTAIPLSPNVAAGVADPNKLAKILEKIAANTSKPPVVIEKPAVPKRPAAARAAEGR